MKQKKFPLSNIEVKIIKDLLDYIDDNLLQHGCHNDLSLTRSFLNKYNVSVREHIIEWLKENGGYCDCEVLANIEDIVDSI